MDNSFNNIFKHLREENNINQKEMAELLNVSPSTISGWETGRNQPSYDVLKNIAKYFDIDIDALVGYENINNHTLSIDEQRLLQNYRLLDKPKRSLVAYYVEIMLDLQKEEHKKLNN